MKPSRKTQARVEPEREMTKRDWEALYLTMRLQEQIVLYGHDAFDVFVTAIREAERSDP